MKQEIPIILCAASSFAGILLGCGYMSLVSGGLAVGAVLVCIGLAVSAAALSIAGREL